MHYIFSNDFLQKLELFFGKVIFQNMYEQTKSCVNLNQKLRFFFPLRLCKDGVAHTFISV